MVVIEREFDRVVTDRLKTGDIDVFLADLQHFLTRSVALHLGRGRVDSQVFRR